MDIENLIWTVSEEGINLVKSGKAVFSSGGIRLLDGTMKEQVKPIARLSTGEYTVSPVISASNSYSTNQIETMINNRSRLIDGKLDNILSMNSQLCKNSALNWANIAIGLVDCSLSYVFYKKQTDLLSQYYDNQTKMLDSILTLLNEIKDKIVEIDNRNRTIEIDTFINQAYSDIIELQNSIIKLEDCSHDIILFLNKYAPFLEALLSDYEKGIIDRDIYMHRIVLSGTLFSIEVAIFSLQYKHINGIYPPNYASVWCNFINHIDSSIQLKNNLWHFIMSQSPEISPLEKRDYYNVLIASFSNHKYNMEINHYLEKRLEINTNVKTLDEILTEKIIKDEALII